MNDTKQLPAVVQSLEQKAEVIANISCSMSGSESEACRPSSPKEWKVSETLEIVKLVSAKRDFANSMDPLNIPIFGDVGAADQILRDWLIERNG